MLLVLAAHGLLLVQCSKVNFSTHVVRGKGSKATLASPRLDNSVNSSDFTRALLDGASFRQTVSTDATFHASTG